MNENKRLLKEGSISFFFLGKMPIAPGTFGTLGALVLAYSIVILIEEFAELILFFMAALFYYIGITLAPWSEKKYGKDPGIYVLDEVIGYLLVVSILLFFKINFDIYMWGTTFLLFRIFDVIKIWPAKDLEYVEKGHGILLDDIAAGFQTIILILILIDFNLFF